MTNQEARVFEEKQPSGEGAGARTIDITMSFGELRKLLPETRQALSARALDQALGEGIERTQEQNQMNLPSAKDE